MKTQQLQFVAEYGDVTAAIVSFSTYMHKAVYSVWDRRRNSRDNGTS
jgi:hypothetical protein